MTLTIYTKPSGCFGCTKTKQKFAEAGLAFREVDITTNQAAFEYITEELGYTQAPVVVYDKDGTENHWAGLNPAKIHQVIAIEKTPQEGAAS
ncbi:glutaredoxin family protein (plasmid) [Arthrobacter sp. FW305-BF8]|uniref:glutaredoxin family protein n=1 Tax=Arthrobacter sp. FW305-BF8 TaxID=2879617 RepID=UPI001F3DE35D|nr:glutaredoxin family protein [Arthrobacter sp. FW305-BF8]UKA56671.1 glutaredoxin family protein [Arthrobacter sp. FW305-BF8]